jgi:hypothetical protein
MKKMLLLIVAVLLLIIVFPVQVLAIEAGGEFKVLFSGVLNDDGSLETEIKESLDLELFFPRIANNEIRYAFRIDKPLQNLLSGNEVSYFASKLYLRHRFDHFHLTLGRQPISWSFGSLLNPVDYTLGAVTLDEENDSKYTDALELYIPVNWNSGLSIVTSFPDGFSDQFEEMKWGIRGRMGLEGYDLTLNYVKETINMPGERIGFTIKGDIGDLGVYGALGHYFANSSNSYLIGSDYSYNLNYYTKINMQLEYSGNERLSLLTGSVNYPLDDFSSISLVTMVNLEDGSFIIMPGYQNTLPGNIDLNINGSIFSGKEDSLFASGNLLPQAVTAISISYPF